MDLLFENSVLILKFDLIGSVAMGLISLYCGNLMKNKMRFLDRFGIPAAVLGGLLFATVHLLLRSTGLAQIQYDTTAQMPFMIVFFTVIGLGSSIEGLRRGGKLLVYFWLLSGFMTFMQTVIGVSLSKAMDIHPLFGVLAGSASMSGGHGSATAFGNTIEFELGVEGALAVGLSAATFGLIAGSLLGAPLGMHLVKKLKLKPVNPVNKEQLEAAQEGEVKVIDFNSTISHIFMLCVVMSVGIGLSKSLKGVFDIALPSYVGAMFCAILFNNFNNRIKTIDMDSRLLNIMGEVSLNIFLSMALISLKLWELAALALPLITILAAQVLFMYLYTRFIVFRTMGSDYDAAVMVSGMCGSGLGTTSNAMINMNEISSKYGYTTNPFLIVPLCGAFLIDMFQMPVIITAINLFK